jgi:hypothetical protein
MTSSATQVGAPRLQTLQGPVPSLVGEGDTDSESLLLAPGEGQYGTINELYAIMMASSKLDTDLSTKGILSAAAQRDTAWDKHIKHLQKAANERKDGGFWADLGGTLGKVASAAAVVGSVALAVASCGAATPIAVLAITGASLSVLGTAQNEFGLLQKIGVSNELSGNIGMGLMIGGGVCSAGAGVLSICGVGTSAAGTAAQGASTASSTTTQVAHHLGQGATIVGGVAGIGAGASGIAHADYQRDALRHDALAVEAMLRAQMFHTMLVNHIDDLKRGKAKETSNVERVVSMNDTLHTTMMTASGGKA